MRILITASAARETNLLVSSKKHYDVDNGDLDAFENNWMT